MWLLWESDFSHTSAYKIESSLCFLNVNKIGPTSLPMWDKHCYIWNTRDIRPHDVKLSDNVGLYNNDSEFQMSIAQGWRYRSPLSPNAKKKYFWHKKNMVWRKQVAKKNSPHKKIATEISPINKLQCTKYLSNNYFNPLIYLPVLLTVSYMYL